jgi:hypothetical protein
MPGTGHHRPCDAEAGANFEEVPSKILVDAMSCVSIGDGV